MVKVADVLVRPQIWLHTSLQEEHASQGLKFGHLAFQLFMAGELETITDHRISRVEHNGQLWLLKQLVYLKGTCEWDILWHIYVTIMHKIELAWAGWGDNFMVNIQ